MARLSFLFTDANTDCKAVKWDAAFEFESCEHGEYAVKFEQVWAGILRHLLHLHGSRSLLYHATTIGDGITHEVEVVERI